MNPLATTQQINRRQFLKNSQVGLGAVALGMLGGGIVNGLDRNTTTGFPELPHYAAKAKRVIYMFQSGAPSQFELFDPKPKLEALHKTELPDSPGTAVPLFVRAVRTGDDSCL